MGWNSQKRGDLMLKYQQFKETTVNNGEDTIEDGEKKISE